MQYELSGSRIPHPFFLELTQSHTESLVLAQALNEAEFTHADPARHGNARVYPFWKVCQQCDGLFVAKTSAQAVRNKTCSSQCAANGVRVYQAQKPRKERVPNTQCATCGKGFWKQPCHKTRTKQDFCSPQCNGVVRGQEWKQHAHKGRAGWTEASNAALIQRMTGATNPAWKGGVTYFKSHGAYAGVKYVRAPEWARAMARKDGYVMEHRLLVAEALGRLLPRTEVVHHVNHIPSDNRIENLMLFACNGDHKSYEHRGFPLPLWSGAPITPCS